MKDVTLGGAWLPMCAPRGTQRVFVLQAADRSYAHDKTPATSRVQTQEEGKKGQREGKTKGLIWPQVAKFITLAARLRVLLRACRLRSRDAPVRQAPTPTLGA